jgi:hypothetical protein
MSARTPRQVAAMLNDHQERTCAGFYVSGGDRCFAARVRNGVLQVRPWFDEDRWEPLNGRPITDHNGRLIVAEQVAL